MQEAVDRGPHQSALSDEAITHFRAEVDEKIKSGQARLVAWDSIKDDPPGELKISPIAAIPHKSKQFRSILDLSFHLQLKQGVILPSVNANTIKTAPKGAIDQLCHTLTRIIHAFAETEEDARFFMAKWDKKDGFWRMDTEEGAEGNFSYVLPQHPGEQVLIVVPTSLQIGWVESPQFFCAASETAWHRIIVRRRSDLFHPTSSQNMSQAMQSMRHYQNEMSTAIPSATCWKCMWMIL